MNRARVAWDPGGLHGPFGNQTELVFADIHDGRNRLQLFIRKNQLSDETWERVLSLDLGDHVGTAGKLMRTRKGELSLAVEWLAIAAAFGLEVLVGPPPRVHRQCGPI